MSRRSLVLLSLLYLDVKQIRLGPTLPAFLTPKVINVLVEKFGLQPMGTVAEDLQRSLVMAHQSNSSNRS
ncbi:MAG: hypothetical protein R2867_20360 [Caldilineaceae bacterium]